MSLLSTKQSRLVNGVRYLLFPPVCLFCQTSLPDGDGCCPDCYQHIAIYPQHACRCCGKPLPESLAPGPCGPCMQREPPQQSSTSLFAYAGPVREGILNWKLQGRDHGVRWLIRAAAPRLQQLLPEDALLLPVPMPISRMRSSGQHHAANLCRWLAAECGCKSEWRILRRTGEQPRQSSLSGQARRRNLRRAFTLADDYQHLLGAAGSLWLVDDIITTGATLHHAAIAAKKAGLPVHLLSLARTLQNR